MHAIKKLTSPSPTPSPHKLARASDDLHDLSPELVPIVTLLSSQSHRRYIEGIFMLYYDLNGDGKPGDREWREVYGILTGSQLAYWDAANLAEFRNDPAALLETSTKPNYLNFTDAVYNAMKTLPAAKQNLDNVIIASTTLKNRYIIQFKSNNDLINWYLALRLSNYEYQALQQAYTGALLSARGSRLSDIRTVLAEKRFDHEDWVSIRYGSGMAWKRCYAVVEPSTFKRKQFTPGRILFYENEQKKKKSLMAVAANASSVWAVYPQSHVLIDHSTMLKLEGYINFKSPTLSNKVSKKTVDDFKNTSIFLMPEQHSSVPGFDTLIRFLVPLLDSFGLYGRPKRLKANRNDPSSLLFGLPTLPHVHYLDLDDLHPLKSRSDSLSWDVKTWNANIKAILQSKIDRGYDGCGSARGYSGALNSLSSPQISGKTNSIRSSESSSVASSNFSKPQPQPPIRTGSPVMRQQQSQPQLPPQNQPLPQQGSPKMKHSRPQPGPQPGPDANGLPQVGPAHRFISHNKGPQPPEKAPVPPPGSGFGSTPTLGSGFGSGAGAGFGAGADAGIAAGGIATARDNNGGKKHNLAPIDPHKSVRLSDIYQKYSDIKSPSDQFNGNRNDLDRSRSSEFLIEEELPEQVKKVNLNENIYPKDDQELFSDDADESVDDDDDSSNSDKVDARIIGMSSSYGSSPGKLGVPHYTNRNSSYSSVQSPSAQYQEFNETFNSLVSPEVSRVQDLYDSDSEPESPPPAPPHQYEDQKVVNVPHGTMGSGIEQESIHSDAGKVSNNSSVYSTMKSSSQQLPRYITSPNGSQNQLPVFKQEDVDSPTPRQRQQHSAGPGPHRRPPPQQFQSVPKRAPPAPQGPPAPQQAPQQAPQYQVPQSTPQYQVPPQQYRQYQAPPQQYGPPPQQYQQPQSYHQVPPQQYQQPPQQYQQVPPQQYQQPPQQYQQVPPQQHRRQNFGPMPQQGNPSFRTHSPASTNLRSYNLPQNQHQYQQKPPPSQEQARRYY